ncbi:hypothetical protein PsYK624_062200 [Phanerochaete sordida]|uniref:Uncharacterized protein n=1 Tax=Phanerochaete sordida TaxID=48140 RepID=A0A9P3G6D2_9APHY|nr:hypothetical protein PsYK624_062200 [Phanerochaete sordida]
MPSTAFGAGFALSARVAAKTLSVCTLRPAYGSSVYHHALEVPTLRRTSWEGVVGRCRAVSFCVMAQALRAVPRLTHETWGHDPKSAPAWLACPTVRYRRSVRRLSRNAQRATHVSVGTALHQHAHVGCPWPFGSGLNFGPLRRESRGPPTVFTPSTTAGASVGALPCTLARILRHVSGVVHLCEYRISATFTDSLVHMDRSRSHYLGKSRGWLITPCATKAVAEDALSLACLFITNMSDGYTFPVMKA